MGRVKERLQYMSYLKAMEMVYRGVFVDYSEYEWMIYEDSYNRSINQMLTDQDYEEYIEENFLDDEGNYHFKTEEKLIMTGSMLDAEQSQINNDFQNNSPVVNNINQDKHTDFDKSITEMNQNFVDHLISDEPGVDDITGHVLNVLMRGFSIIGQIKEELSQHTEPAKSSDLAKNNMSSGNDLIVENNVIGDIETDQPGPSISQNYDGLEIRSPPISVSSSDSGYTDVHTVENNSVFKTFAGNLNSEHINGDVTPSSTISLEQDIIEDTENSDEIPVWLKGGLMLPENHSECNEINTPQHSMASVIALQLAAGSKKSKRKGKSHRNNGRNNNKVKSYTSYGNGITV
jgi:hypothetical protein